MACGLRRADTIRHRIYIRKMVLKKESMQRNLQPFLSEPLPAEGTVESIERKRRQRILRFYTILPKSRMSVQSF